MIAEADIDKDGSVDFNEFQVLSLIAKGYIIKDCSVVFKEFKV